MGIKKGFPKEVRIQLILEGKLEMANIGQRWRAVFEEIGHIFRTVNYPTTEDTYKHFLWKRNKHF